MPAVVLLDSSLSMIVSDGQDSLVNRKKLAEFGLEQFLDELHRLNVPEQISFSNLPESVSGFTRDFETLIHSFQKCQLKSRSRLFPALALATSLCETTWNSLSMCQIFVVSDGNCIERHGLSDAVGDLFCSKKRKNLSMRIHFVLVAPAEVSKPEDLTEILTNSGQNRNENTEIEVHCISSPTLAAASDLFTSLAEQLYSPLNSELRCGNLKSSIRFFPSPTRFFSKISADAEISKKDPDVNRNWKSIEIIGFLKPADLGNPPIVSQHLLLTTDENPPKKCEKNSGSDPDAKMKPNFSALLHGGLKMENMVAVCQLGSSVDQFGLIYFIPDSKRSNLVLQILDSGPNPVPWLGDFRSLKMRPFEMDAKLSGFPIPFKTKPSYGQLATIHAWTENSGLQVDVQKIMRYARKLPDKESNFFLELNRVIDYALMIGCKELLELLSDVMKKEAESSQSEPAIRQLKHVANLLRSGHLQYGQQIKPLS